MFNSVHFSIDLKSRNMQVPFVEKPQMKILRVQKQNMEYC